ncbi:hypothetical protein BY996DRAFT_6416369 [Phakopsora pachyrhizi]|nr:hypothetical protein BY996DRAFT_6416369 [Phakopsora pachyrhizi]
MELFCAIAYCWTKHWPEDCSGIGFRLGNRILRIGGNWEPCDTKLKPELRPKLQHLRCIGAGWKVGAHQFTVTLSTWTFSSPVGLLYGSQAYAYVEKVSFLWLSRRRRSVVSGTVQEVTIDFSNKHLGKSLNNDEAPRKAAQTFNGQNEAGITRPSTANIPNSTFPSTPMVNRPSHSIEVSRLGCLSPTSSAKRSHLTISTNSSSLIRSENTQHISRDQDEEEETRDDANLAKYSDDPFAPPTPGVMVSYRKTSPNGVTYTPIMSPRNSFSTSNDNVIGFSSCSSIKMSSLRAISPHRLPLIQPLPSINVEEITSPSIEVSTIRSESAASQRQQDDTLVIQENTCELQGNLNPQPTSTARATTSRLSSSYKK